MRKIHTIHLTQQEKGTLAEIVTKGREQARVITRARVLLLADEGKTDPEIYAFLALSTKTPYAIRKRYREGGLSVALYDRPRPGQPRKLNGSQEAKITAIACTKAPKGYRHWTMDLLTKEVHNKLQIGISRSAVYHVLLRNNLKPWREKNVGDFRDYA
jgi:transposase